MATKTVLKGLRATNLGAMKSLKPIHLEDSPSAVKLPEAYKKFWREWKYQKPAPVHYVPEPGKWKRNPETGEVSPIQNTPIPLQFTPEMENMLLGGEKIIKGFVKPQPLCRRVPRWWVPVVKRTVVHSEVLGIHMSALVTERLLRLIHKHHGFDYYLLQTPACDLHTLLAVKLKRKVLLALATGDYHRDNPQKQAYILDKYGKYAIPLEEAEWYGLTWKEAMMKHHLSQVQEPKPLKHQFRAELLQRLRESEIDVISETEQKSSWLSKINPFSSKEASNK